MERVRSNLTIIVPGLHVRREPHPLDLTLTPSWHPSPQLIASYASGTLLFSPALAISVHLEGCSDCCAAVREVEEAEGRLLSAEEGSPLGPDALATVLARLDPPPQAPSTASAELFRTNAIALPASLEGLGFLPPVKLGQDAWVAHLDAERRDGWRTYVFCGPANTVLPPHGHHGEELIVVLEGAFRDQREFRAGDFVENKPGFVHDMQVSPEGRLVALIASAGPIVWRAKDRTLGELLDI